MKKGSRRFNSLLIDTFTFCFWSEESICSPIFFKKITNHLISNFKTSLHIVHREIYLSSGFDSILYMLGLICFTYIVSTIWNSREFCVVCLARCLHRHICIYQLSTRLWCKVRYKIVYMFSLYPFVNII